jgi:hypothetical protein
MLSLLEARVFLAPIFLCQLGVEMILLFSDHLTEGIQILSG